MPWILAAGYHVAFQGGLEGRRGLALLRVAVELANHSEQGEGQVVELQQQFLKVKGPPQAHAHTHKEDGASRKGQDPKLNSLKFSLGGELSL